MADQSSHRPTDAGGSEGEVVAHEARPHDSAVDDAAKRRLEEAYLNEGSGVLIVQRVRSVGDGTEVVVEMRPPHGGATHTERFDGPKHGSLDECEELLAFLESAGVSPLDLDGLVGTRIPATFDPERGWRLDGAFARRDGKERTTSSWRQFREWLGTYRDWLLVVLIVGVELLFVVLLILAFG